jgi:hypothetical protein
VADGYRAGDVCGEGLTIEHPPSEKALAEGNIPMRSRRPRDQRVVIVKFTVMWASVSTACPDL